MISKKENQIVYLLENGKLSQEWMRILNYVIIKMANMFFIGIKKTGGYSLVKLNNGHNIFGLYSLQIWNKLFPMYGIFRKINLK